MTTETLRTIVDNLNAPPFKKNLTLITFDSMTTDKLLQITSDVLCWIQGVPDIDIRSETPDETAMRLLNSLRILKYPPPKDIDQIQKWRLGILEGEKMAIYPVLEWTFKNVDRLKERVYLANYLTRIEVPVEDQSPEVVRLVNQVYEKMEEFKAIHSRIIESRTDFAAAEDIRADLKAMEEEKEQLTRKIERSRRKVANRTDLNRYLTLAAQLRQETEHNQELQHQRQEQRNALVRIEQRIQRLTRMLADLKREKDNIDPEKYLARLQKEIETNTYVLNEKLLNEIEVVKKNIEGVNKILNMRSVNQADVGNLKQKVENLNREIMEITMQRDKKDEASEDKLTIYRHQCTNVQRKKANIAEQLQTTRHDLDETETQLAIKKRELGEKTGKEELITSVQFKNYVNKLRNKTNVYKRKKAEMEDMKTEITILTRTEDILESQWKELKESIISEGRGVIEDPTFSQKKRPTTSAISVTDASKLKAMVKELNDQLNVKQSEVHQLKGEVEDFSRIHKKAYEEFSANENQFKNMERELQQEKEATQNVNLS
uniref:Intraflagellar transport protein 81 homolog n=1 Tax=Acrobeloides nanus TaxID=290746 RepID=A0A914CP04_9BILA